jgi:hypothetical protein
VVKVREYLVRCGLLLVSGFLTLVILEGVVRVFFPYAQDSVLPGRLFVIDEYLGWKLKAGKQVTHRSRSFEVLYSTNSLGFRDKPRRTAKAAGIYRILVYGDSQVFGWGVPEERRFSNVIESQTPSVELWNLAVPAYGFDQQVLSYEQDGASLNGDEILLFVSERTLQWTHRDYMGGRYKPVFVEDPRGLLQIVPPKEVVKTRLLYELLSPLYLPHFAELQFRTFLAILEKRQEERSRAGTPKANPSDERIGELEKKILSFAKNLAEQRKHKVSVLSVLPHPRDEALRDFCGHNHIGFLAIDFGGNRGDLVFNKHDTHWTLWAHQMIVEQILAQAEWAGRKR